MDTTTAISRVSHLLHQFGLDIQLNQKPGGAIEGRLSFPGGSLPVLLQPANGTWLLVQGLGASVGDVARALALLLGGDHVLGRVLPPDILGLATLAVEKLNVGFDVDLTVPTRVSYTLRSPAPWVVVKDQIVLHQLRAEVTVSEPLGNAKLRVSLAGALRVGNIDLPLVASVPQAIDQFELPSAIKEWPFELKNFAGALDLGALLDALGLAEVRAVLKKLPENLDQLGMPLTDMGLVWDIENLELRKVDANLTPQNAKLVVKLQPVCTASFELAQLRVAYDIEQEVWSVVGDAKLKLNEMAAALDGVFPDELNGHLEIVRDPGSDEYEVIASTEREKLANVAFGARKLAMEIANTELRWPDGNPELTCNLAVSTGNDALPVGLNLPVKDTLHFRVTLNPSNNEHPLRLMLLEWPFTVFNVPVHEGKLLISLRDIVEAEVDVPGLDLTFPIPKEIKVDGAITVRNAAIPLPFLHDLAAGIGLGRYVPDRIAVIKDGKPIQIEMPSIGGSCLPGDLKKYGEIKLPNAFDYTVTLTTNGALDIALNPQKTAASPNEKAATTVMGTPLLATGTQVQKLGWGEFYGLQTVKLSAQGDVFSPVLIEALAAVSCKDAGPLAKILPSADQLRTSWRLGDVRLLLVPPIPIPIFFDPIEFHYLGVEGLGIDLSWSLPEPTLSEQADLISQIIGFLASGEPDRLEADKLPELAFKADPLLGITLPKYLGAVPLKIDTEVDGREILAAQLNFLKNPSPAGVILAIPRQYRVGSTFPKEDSSKPEAEKAPPAIKVGPITLNAAYAITCAGEWGDAEAAKFFEDRLKPEAAETALAIFGSASEYHYGHHNADAKPEKKEGAEAIAVSKDSVLVLLHGGFTLGALANTSCTLGLALVGSGGFATAVALRCELLAGVLGLELDAIVRVFRDESSLSLLAGGRAHITLLGHKLFDASVFLKNDAFGFHLNAELPSFLPVKGSIFDATGSLTDKGKFELAGKINGKLGPVPLIDVAARITNTGTELIWFEMRLFDAVTIELSLDKSLTFRGETGVTIGERSFKLKPVTWQGVTIIPETTVEVPNVETKISVWVSPTRFGISGKLLVSVVNGVIGGSVPFSLDWDLNSIPANLDELWEAIKEFLEDMLIRRPIQILGDIGMKICEWIGLAATWTLEKLNQFCQWLGQQLGAATAEMGKVLGDMAAGVLDAATWVGQLGATAFAGIARWDPATWDMALNWRQSNWLKAVKLPTVSWDLSQAYAWIPDDWDFALALEIADWSGVRLQSGIQEFTDFFVRVAPRFPDLTADQLADRCCALLGVSKKTGKTWIQERYDEIRDSLPPFLKPPSKPEDVLPHWLKI